MGNVIRVGIVRVGLRINKLLLRRRHRKKGITILLLGLQKVGKTTIGLRFSANHKNKPFVHDPKYIQTKGFNTTDISYRRNVTVKLHDLGGHESIRELWTHYYTDAHGIIFVVDLSCSEEELGVCSQVFQALVSEGRVMRKPILMLLNKQDLANTFTEGDIIQKMDLLRLVNSARCLTRVESCSAVGNKKGAQGISDGFDWLVKFIIWQYEELNERVLADIMDEKESSKTKFPHNHPPVSNRLKESLEDSQASSEFLANSNTKERLPPDGGNAEENDNGLQVGVCNEAFVSDELPSLTERKIGEAKLAFEPLEEIVMVTTKVLVHGKDVERAKGEGEDKGKPQVILPTTKPKPSGFSVLKRKNKTAPMVEEDFPPQMESNGN